MSAPLLLIAAGGTGGHMFPAQALAEAMLRRGWRVRLSTDARGARFVGGFPHSVQIEQVSSATFARGGIVNRLLAPLHIAGGVLGASLRMLRDRPDAVWASAVTRRSRRWRRRGYCAVRAWCTSRMAFWAA